MLANHNICHAPRESRSTQYIGLRTPVSYEVEIRFAIVPVDTAIPFGSDFLVSLGTRSMRDTTTLPMPYYGAKPSFAMVIIVFYVKISSNIYRGYGYKYKPYPLYNEL